MLTSIKGRTATAIERGTISPVDPHATSDRPADDDNVVEHERLISAEDLVGPEWAEWYAMTPVERWAISQRLFAEYVAMGGSLEPEVDTQSPFWGEADLTEFARARPIDGIEHRSRDSR